MKKYVVILSLIIAPFIWYLIEPDRMIVQMIAFVLINGLTAWFIYFQGRFREENTWTMILVWANFGLFCWPYVIYKKIRG